MVQRTDRCKEKIFQQNANMLFGFASIIIEREFAFRIRKGGGIMEDGEIIGLYHQRNEQAIQESDQKYGYMCRGIAKNILYTREDAEECVNDTWYAAWIRMPPDKPQSLGAFLGRITRNLSISRWRSIHAKKRGGGMEILLSELDECVPDPDLVEQKLDQKELARLLDQWLDSLPKEESVLFVRRYWYGEAVKELAAKKRCTQNQMAQQMMRLRKKLKRFLEQEGVQL